MTVYAAEQQIKSGVMGGSNWTLRGLTDVTVLIGKNGSGKSVLLRSWRDSDPDSTHYIAPERTGEMDFNPNFIQEEMEGSRRMGYSTRNYVPEYRRRIIGRVQTYFMIRGNFRGQVVAPGDPDELELLLNSLASDFSAIFRIGNPPYELKRLSNNETINRIDQLSSGEAQLFSVGLDILTISAIWELEKREQRIILLDEPDAHIHPDLQARFADFVFRVSERFNLQFIIATHSTSLLSAIGMFGNERASVIFLERNQREYQARKFDSVAKEVAACLGGHVLMGPLFGAPILLVEGDDDYRIWNQVPRHHLINLAVISTNGEEIKRYQLILERILNCLSDPQPRPLGYALLDGDKRLPRSSPANKQQFIRFIKLNCHEAENLYLTDEVLNSISRSWDEAKRMLVDASESYGNKALFLKEAPTWDRKGADIKMVINEIAEILDKKKLPWTLRVGNVLGSSRPSGQLEEFLGVTVVQSLWPSQPTE